MFINNGKWFSFSKQIAAFLLLLFCCFNAVKALIVGSTIVVCNDIVNKPFAVRYAWADNPEGANLINSAGIPASPLRTDSQ